MNSLATVSSSCSETDKTRFLRAVLAALMERLEASSEQQGLSLLWIAVLIGGRQKAGMKATWRPP